MIDHDATRTHRGAAPARFVARYRPTSPRYPARSNTSSRSATASTRRQGNGRRNSTSFRGDIAHAPWPLQPAEAELETVSMTEQLGLRDPDARPILHYAHQLDTVAWLTEPCGAGSEGAINA